MPSEVYLRKLTRNLAQRMIYLDHALEGACRRGDVAMAQQYWFQRYRTQRYRSDLLRQLWLQHTAPRRKSKEVDGAEEQALRPAGV